jgi:hypothetical protein
MESWLPLQDEAKVFGYLQGLNYLCKAIELMEDETTGSAQSATHCLLQSAHQLIDIYNSGYTNLPIAFTLARVFDMLGKRSESVELIKGTLESLLIKKEKADLSLPFLPPLAAQDHINLIANPEHWCKMRTIEAWVLLKDVSTFFSGEQEIQMIESLTDTPGILPVINKIGKELIPQRRLDEANATPKKKFLHFCFNHVYGKSLSDLIEYTNAHSDQEHWLYVELHRAIEHYHADLDDNRYTTFFDFQRHMNTVIDRCKEEDVQGVFIHGLFFDWQKQIIQEIAGQKHIGWIIWGGDLYNPIKNGKLLQTEVQRIDSIHTPVEGDIELFHTTYGDKDSYEYGYPYPGLYGNLSASTEKDEPRLIIVGNSGDKSNNHIDVLRALSRKSDIKNYKLILPVSYNLRPEYEKELINEIALLGLSGQTELSKEFLSPEEYFKLMNRASMLITAHDRQQAIGNILASLYSGNATFVKDEIIVDGKKKTNPTWDFLHQNKLSASKLDDLFLADSIEDLLRVDEELIAHHQNMINSHFGLEVRAQQLVQSCDQILEKRQTKREELLV